MRNQTEKLLIATSNPGKVNELKGFLDGDSFELLSLTDFSAITEVEEIGRTFDENARLKASGYALQTGLFALADDSGLEVEGLGGRPGVLSARYGGASTSFTEKMAELLVELRRIYGGSVPIFPISAAERSGLAPLEEFLSEGHRGAFVGTTGVGKSSLLNALCPEIDLKVGSLSEYKGMGRHTTTVSTLHALSGGGELVDTPGFRDFGLVDITVEELAEYFPGFEDHRNVACKFRNCRHRSEPGCAVLALVEQGRIPAERYATYMEILKEVESLQAAARSRDWKN